MEYAITIVFSLCAGFGIGWGAITLIEAVARRVSR
jgi:hypothetical protein